MTQRLQRWLRFDAQRVPVVEEAYRDFVRHSKPGVAFFIALVIAIGAAVGLDVVLVARGWAHSRTMGPVVITFGTVFYGALFFAVVRSPLPVLRTMLAGAVSWPRASLLALGLGVACVVAELAIVSALVLALHLHSPSATIDYFSGGLIVGMLVLALGAPVVEEFLMQGWFQTRVQRLGPFWAGAVTTIVFVLIHLPTSFLDLARGVALGTAAWFRATTRSMLACIVVHATNNIAIAGLLLAARVSGHR
jgi:membrane protease YdiL (CAAX protease family)